MLNKYLNTLFIIGNGFDIYSGLPTKMSDFKKWLDSKDYTDEILRIEKTFNIKYNNNWCFFEQKMFESRSHLESTIDDFQESASYSISGNWEELYHIEHEKSLIVEDDVSNELILSDKLNSLVSEWIRHTVNENKIQKINLHKSNKLINFNYTDYIKGDIFNIHGQYTQKIEFGHADNSENLRPKGDYGTDEISGVYLYKLYKKNIDKNILEMNKFIKKTKYNQIVFFGFSLGEQDQKYIQQLDKNDSIIFYYYEGSDLQKAENFFEVNKFKNVQFKTAKE